MSGQSSKNSVADDDDDDQDYIPVGVLQVSSIRPQPSSIEQQQAQLQSASGQQYNNPKQLNHPPSIHQHPTTALNLSQFNQLETAQFEQGQSTQKNEAVEFHTQSPQSYLATQRSSAKFNERDDFFRMSNREQEGKQEHLPQYKLLLQLMQQQQRAQAQGIHNDQINQSKLQAKPKTSSSSMQSDFSPAENQKQSPSKISSRGDLNSNVPFESQNQLLKILTLAQQRNDSSQNVHSSVHPQTVQKQHYNSGVDRKPISNSSEIQYHPTTKHAEHDSSGSSSSVASRSALRIDISSSFQHIPKSTEHHYLQQSPTSSSSALGGFHPHNNNSNNPNINHHQHPEITKRLNSPVSPGRQSTSPRQAVSPRQQHTEGTSPHGVSSSPCQFISPKQPVSPRGGAGASSRRSQPSSPQSFHSPNQKVQPAGFSWHQQPPYSYSPISSLSQVVPATKKLSTAISNTQDLPQQIPFASQIQPPNPLSSLTALTHEATAENIHHHPSRFQPIPKSTRQRSLSGGGVHIQSSSASETPNCQRNLSNQSGPGPFLRETALNPIQTSSSSSVSQQLPLVSQNKAGGNFMSSTQQFNIYSVSSNTVDSKQNSSAKTDGSPSAASMKLQEEYLIQKTRSRSLGQSDNSNSESSRQSTSVSNRVDPKLSQLNKTGDNCDRNLSIQNIDKSESKEYIQNTGIENNSSVSATQEKMSTKSGHYADRERKMSDIKNKSDDKSKSDRSDNKNKSEKSDDKSKSDRSDNKNKSEKSDDKSESEKPNDKSKLEKMEALNQQKGIDLQVEVRVSRSEVNENVKKLDRKQNTFKDEKHSDQARNSPVSENVEPERIDRGENVRGRESSSKRLRKPKVPFDDNSRGVGKVKKDEKNDDKASHGKNDKIVESPQKQKSLKVSSVLKQSVLTRSSLRRKGRINKLQTIKNNDIRNNRSQFIKAKSLRGSDFKYQLSKTANNGGKEMESKQKIANTVTKESEKSLKNGSKTSKEIKQDQTKANEVTLSQTKGKHVSKDGKKDQKKGSEQTQEQKRDKNGRDIKEEQKKSNDTSKEHKRDQRRGSDVDKRPDKEPRQNLNKDSVPAADSETNTRSSSRLSARQSNNSVDKSISTDSSNSRSRLNIREHLDESKKSRHCTREPSEESKGSRHSTREPSEESKKSRHSTRELSEESKKSRHSTREPSEESKKSRHSTREPSEESKKSRHSTREPSEESKKSRHRTRESSEESSSTLNERISTRGSKIQEPSLSTERVSTRASKSHEPVKKEPKSAPNEEVTTKDLKAQDSNKESNSAPATRVSTRGSKAQESSGDLTPKEKTPAKDIKSHDTAKDSDSILSKRVATRSSKSQEVSEGQNSNSNKGVSTRRSAFSDQTSISIEKTDSPRMTTRHSDGTRSAAKTHTPTANAAESLVVNQNRKRTRSEEVPLPPVKDLSSKNSEARSGSARAKSGLKEVKHSYDSDEEEYDEEEEEESSDGRMSPTTTRSGRVTSIPKTRREISMRLRREASKRKYNLIDDSASEESTTEDEDDDDDDDSDEEMDQSENESNEDNNEKKFSPSEVEVKPESSVADIKGISRLSSVSAVDSPDLSKLMGFKLVPLSPEEMAETRDPDSMLPLSGLILPGKNCIFLPPHFTQHLKTEKKTAKSVSQACTTKVLTTPRPISSISESTSSKPSGFSSPSSSSGSLSLSSSHGPHHSGLRNQSIVPSLPTPPPAVPTTSSSSSSLPSSTRIASSSSTTSSNPWNSPSLPTPPPSVSSSSSVSSSTWNPVVNLQPWIPDSSTPAWTDTSSTTNEGWRSNNNNNNIAYLSRVPYGDNNNLGLTTDVLHNSAPISTLSGSVQNDGLYGNTTNDRLSSSSPPMEAGLFRDSSNLSPSGYNNIALPGLGQQDISYLESNLQQDMDISSSMLLSDVPYEDEIPEPVSTVHHGGIPVCSVNLDDADMGGRLGNVNQTTLHLPGESAGGGGGGSSLENMSSNNMHHMSQQQLQQQQQQQQQPTGYNMSFKEDRNASSVMMESCNIRPEQQQQQQRVETSNANMVTKTDEASTPNIVGNTGISLMNTRKHLYELHLDGDKKMGKCKICGNSYSLSSIYRHLKKHDNPNIGYPCSVCGKKYSQKYNAVAHMKKVHNVGNENPGIALEDGKKQEMVEVPKGDQEDSLDDSNAQMEKSSTDLQETESLDLQQNESTKDSCDIKEAKKKPRKRSVERKYTKDGLVYELMPESPNPINADRKRKMQKQVARVRRMRAKVKFEAGKNVHGITYDLSLLDADTSDDEEYNDEEEKRADREVDKIGVASGVGGYDHELKPEDKSIVEFNVTKSVLSGCENMVVPSEMRSGVVAVATGSSNPTSTSTTDRNNTNTNIPAGTESGTAQYQDQMPSNYGNELNPSMNMDVSNQLSAARAVTMDPQNESLMLFEDNLLTGEQQSSGSEAASETNPRATPSKDKYPCTLCSSILASKCSFFLHMKRHKSVKDKVCNYCGKGFITGQELKSHERTHTGERPYQCEICKYTFAHQGSYQTHKKGHIKRGETEPFPPEKCFNEGKQQVPLRRKKRAVSDGVGVPRKKAAVASTSSSEQSEIRPISVQKDPVSGSGGGDVQTAASSDSAIRRSSVDSSSSGSGFSQNPNFENREGGTGGGGGMRPPSWSVPSPGMGGISSSWDNRRASTEQLDTPRHGNIGNQGNNKGMQRSSATNLGDQSVGSPFYSPTQYGSPATESPRMSPNFGHSSNPTTPTGVLPQHSYLPQSQHPTSQIFPVPHSGLPYNMNTIKSPTHDQSFPTGGNSNHGYGSSSSLQVQDEGQLFASPGPPPPTASLVHPRKQQQQQQQQHMPHSPQNYSPSQQQQYGIYGGPTSANSSPSHFSAASPHHQPGQPLPRQPQPQEQSDDIVNTLLNQYNIPPSSPYSGNTGQVDYNPNTVNRSPLHTSSSQMMTQHATPMQPTSQHQRLQQQQRHSQQPSSQQQLHRQVPSQYHHHLQQQQQQQQQYHQFRQSPGLQHQQQKQQPQQPTSGHQHSMQQLLPQQSQPQSQQQPPPPPPYTPNQAKPPPPYPSSSSSSSSSSNNPYNEFYRSPQHGLVDESQQQTPRMQSPSIQHTATHSQAHPNFSNTPYTNTSDNINNVSSPANLSAINANNTNNNFSQPGVLPSALGPQMTPSVHRSSPSMNQPPPQPYHHNPSPSSTSTPSPGLFPSSF